jgi:hypothetical protein
MLSRMIGATATSVLARQLGGVASGPAGAVLGFALPFVARRLGPMGMIAMAVGAWAMTRVLNGAAAKAGQAPGPDDPAAAPATITVKPTSAAP